ncbi:MAG: DUF4037 domain-containing protein [Coriobacteriia bacterium]|nr:DUF4037 domain-containing protein [Coriobacteriia bacterium]
MNGLELAEAFWWERGYPALCELMDDAIDRVAAGMVGEGSECFGFDDRYSRDHHWGPAFCLWLTADDMHTWAAPLQKLYTSLSKEGFGGFDPRIDDEMSATRVGVQSIPTFYHRHLGVSDTPPDLSVWRTIPEESLAVATNGKVFVDRLGEFSRIRDELLRYYPEELRLRRLADGCFKAARSGQYNLARARKRDHVVTSFGSLARFIDEMTRAIYTLNRCYRPFYKWAHQGLRMLPRSGAVMAESIEHLLALWAHTSGKPNKQMLQQVDDCALLLVDELLSEGLTDEREPWLLSHCDKIMLHIDGISCKG